MATSNILTLVRGLGTNRSIGSDGSVGTACAASTIVILSWDNVTVKGGLLLFVVLAVLAILGVLLVRSRARDLSQAKGELETFCAVHGVPVTGDSLRLVDRYLGRSARFRSGWTWIGIALWAVLSFPWGPTAGRTVGLVGYPPTSDIFLMGLAAWFVGLVRCETYNLRPRLHGPREASLMPRQVERYAPRRLLIHNRVGVVVSWSLVILDLLLPGPREHFDVVVVFAGVSLLALVVGELCQRGIAMRPRPALGADLLAADEAIRTVAARSVGYGMAGLEALLIGSQGLLLEQAPPYVATTQARMLIGLVGFGLILWAAALALNARRQIQPLRDRSVSHVKHHAPVPVR